MAQHYYVRLNPDLSGVEEDPTIHRAENPTQEDALALMGEASEDPSRFEEARRAIAMVDRDSYARIERVEAFGREFVGGGGEVITEEERALLEDEGSESGAGKANGKTQDGVPLLVVLAKLEV